MRKSRILVTAAICAFFTVPCSAADTYTPTLGDKSSYTVEDVGQGGSDYTFVISKPDDKGFINNYYYKVEMKPVADANAYTFETTTSDADNVSFVIPSVSFGTSYYYSAGLSPDKMSNLPAKKVQWSATPLSGDYSGSVTFTLPNSDKTTTLYYSYDAQTYTPAGARIDDTLSAPDVTNKVFDKKSADSKGGAIYNTKDNPLVNITSDFIENSAKDSGGAIYNGAKIGKTNGTFIGNHADGTSGASAGAIYNSGNAGDITGAFIGNYAKASGGNAEGGAIFNDTESSVLGKLSGNFIGNYVNGNGESNGGALANYGTTGDITADFLDNKAIDDTDSASGGAIYSAKATGNVTGNFVGNYAKGKNSASGGAIYSAGTTGDISGEFIRNYAVSTDGNAQGGAVTNIDGTIKSITGDFIGNSATGAAKAYGGAIYNTGTAGNIKGDFVANVSEGKSEAYGGAIYNTGKVGDITGLYINNSAKANAESGAANAYGGAIYHKGTDALNIKGDLIGNSASVTGSDSSSASGGAVYSAADVNFTADTRDITIKDNYTLKNGTERDDNAIFVEDGKSINFDVKTGKNIYLYDNTRGAGDYTVNITGTGTMHLFNDLNGANVVIGGVNLNTSNNDIHDYQFKSLTLNSNVKMTADADLSNLKMDTINADSVTAGTSKINVGKINVTWDSDDATATVNFTSTPDLQKRVSCIGTQAKSFIYNYSVAYDPTTGNMKFTKGGFGYNGGNPPYSAFNPAVVSSEVAAQAGAYLNSLNAYEQSFSNLDQTMLMTRDERLSMKYANKYASLQGTGAGGTMTFSPNQIPEQSAGLYFRPYVTFEKVDMNNGPDVENISYGTLIGAESGLIELPHGWDMQWGGYVGYTGSHQDYDGVSVYQNGGLLGFDSVFYKDNFFTGLTANVGATNADASTMYGNEDFTTLATGIASKTGYNWELADSKLTIQPSLLLSYTFVNTFDYTNAAGVRINSDPINAMQIAPGLKLIGNLKNSWQPYVGVQMVWNLMDKAKFYANDVSLPQMSVDPYVQYGVGVQKRKGDRFTCYGQAMVRNGGRRGIALSAGLRWSLGK